MDNQAQTQTKFPYTTIALGHPTKERLKKFAATKEEDFDVTINRLMNFAEKHDFCRLEGCLSSKNNGR